MMMVRSKKLAEEAAGIYTSGKEFAYDHVARDKVVPINRGTDTRINIKVSAQRRSMKGILLLFVEPYSAGARDSEIHLPRPEKNQRHDQRLAKHAVQQQHRESGHLERSKPIFHERRTQTSAYDAAKVLRKKQVWASDRSSLNGKPKNAWQRYPYRQLHRGVQLEIERDGKGSGTVNCHVYIISDSQFNIINRQLDSVQY